MRAEERREDESRRIIFIIIIIIIIITQRGRIKIKGVYSDIRQKTRILGELRQDINTWKTQRRDHTAIWRKEQWKKWWKGRWLEWWTIRSKLSVLQPSFCGGKCWLYCTARLAGAWPGSPEAHHSRPGEGEAKAASQPSIIIFIFSIIIIISIFSTTIIIIIIFLLHHTSQKKAITKQSEKFLDLGTVTRPPSSIYARVTCFVIRDWCTRVQGHQRNLFRRPWNFGLSSLKHHTWPYHASVLWYTEANLSLQMQQRNFPTPYLRNDTMDFLF